MKPGIILSTVNAFRTYEILPNLWLGNLNACLNKKLLKKNVVLL